MRPAFLPVNGFDGLYYVRSGSLSCTAFQLSDGSLCLYSPVAGLEYALKAQEDDLGPVSAILAPNHYHNKGLAAHVAAFPHAALHCSDAAAPRLTKITGLEFVPLDGLRRALRGGQLLHETEGLKTGEVWVQIPSPTGSALVVTDAFSSAAKPPVGESDRVTMLRTFPRYGVADSKAYRTWATDLITAAAPTLLLPCHGSPVRSDKLVSQLIRQLKDLP